MELAEANKSGRGVIGEAAENVVRIYMSRRQKIKK